MHDNYIKPMHYVDGEEIKNTFYLNNCGAETWALAKQVQNKLATAWTTMERSMLNITSRPVQEQEDQQQGQGEDKRHMIDIISNVRTIKWSWAHPGRVLGWAYQPPQRPQMDLKYHHL